MNPIKPPNHNITFTLQGLGDLPAFRDPEGGGITTCWELSADEKAGLAQGAPLCVALKCKAPPPMHLFVAFKDCPLCNETLLPTMAHPDNDKVHKMCADLTLAGLTPEEHKDLSIRALAAELQADFEERRATTVEIRPGVWMDTPDVVELLSGWHALLNKLGNIVSGAGDSQFTEWSKSTGRLVELAEEMARRDVLTESRMAAAYDALNKAAAVLPGLEVHSWPPGHEMKRDAIAAIEAVLNPKQPGA